VQPYYNVPQSKLPHLPVLPLPVTTTVIKQTTSQLEITKTN